MTLIRGELIELSQQSKGSAADLPDGSHVSTANIDNSGSMLALARVGTEFPS